MLTPSRETILHHNRPLTPLTTLHHPHHGTVNLYYFHCTLVTHTEATGFTDVATLQSEPFCAIPLTDAFLIMTEQGPLTLSLTDDGWDTAPSTGSSASFPAITVTTRNAGTLTAATEPLDIDGVDFSRSDPSLPQGASKEMARRLADTYSSLSLQAVLGNLWIQPIILRYRIISHTGTTLHTSAPMVIAPHGWQCCNLLSATCSRSGSTLSIPAITLSAQAFTLNISIDPNATWHQSASAVEFMISPQIHPVDLDADTPCRLQRNTTSAPILTIAMPGTTSAMASLAWQRTDALRNILARIDTLPATHTRFALPLTESVTALPNTSSFTVPHEIQLIRDTLAQNITVTPNQGSSALMRDIASPNSFYARTALVSADTIIWGDITPIPSLGHPVTDLAASFSPGAWTGVLRIHMQSGQIIAGHISGSDLMPVALSPVISYPHPQASMLEIFVRHDADPTKILHASVPLSPSPSGTHAIYIHPSLTAVQLVATDRPIPDINNHDTAIRHHGTLIATSAANPLSSLAAIQCSTAPILALTPAVRSASSWDFSRCRIYAFSPAGIYAVALNASQSSFAATIIDRRGVLRQRAVAHTPLGVMALSGSELLSVIAARATTLDTGTTAVELGWDSPSQSLWLIDHLGNLTSRHIPSGYAHSILTPEPVNAIHSTPSTLILATADNLLIPSKPYSTHRPILYTRTIHTPFPTRPMILEIGIAAAEFQGTIALRAHSIHTTSANHEYPITTLQIHGAINAPIRIPIVAPPRPYITIRIQATTSPDLTITHLRIHHAPSRILKPTTALTPSNTPPYTTIQLLPASTTPHNLTPHNP